MKKLFACVIIFALLLTFVPLAVLAEESPTDTVTYSAEEPLYEVTSGTCGDNVTWSYDTETYTLTISGTGAMEDYGFKNGCYNFAPWIEYDSDIQIVIIENGITRIGDNAFTSIQNLKCIIISDSVTSIGEYAFSPYSLTAWVKRGTIAEQYIIENGVSYGYIGETYSGQYGENVTWTLDTETGTLTIGGTGAMTVDYYLPTIPWYNYRYIVKSLIVGEGVTKISRSAVGVCTYLASIEVSPQNTVYDSRDNCNAIIETSSNELIFGCRNTIIPNSVTEVGREAFMDCETLSSIVIPSSVTIIGGDAFGNCHSLKNITISNRVTFIDSYAFYNCSSLANIIIPSSVKVINAYAFCDCTSLTSIEVDIENVKYASLNGVLFNKDGSTLICYPAGKIGSSYTVPNSVTCIEAYAFRSSQFLTSITLSENVTDVGEKAFEYCGCLERIDVHEGNVNFTSENGVLYNNDKTNLIYYPEGKTDALFTIPSSVKTVGEGAFERCFNLKSIAVPESVKTISPFAFMSCIYLKDVYYAGTEEEWNNIDFTYNNDTLLNATIHYNSAPLPSVTAEIKAPTVTETTVTATVTCAEGISAKALCVMYDNGKLVSVRIVELKAGDNALIFTGYNTELTAKLFVIDDGAFKPLCEAASAAR